MFSNKRKIHLPPVRRSAGESLRERRETQIFDKLLVIVFVPFVLWFAYFVTTVQQWNPSFRNPRFWFVLSLIATVAAAVWFVCLLPLARRLNRGERGERYVADILEQLRRDGYRPVHDIVGDGFNVDHVIVGPAGVFVIETKYRSGRGEITFRNAEGLMIGGRLEEKDCLKQARSAAKAVREIVAENCGKKIWVPALLVFVGDWRVKNEWRDTDVRVLAADRLANYVRRQQPQLTHNEVELIASHLERSTRD